MRAPRFAENLFAALFRLDLEARGFAKKPMHLFSARFASASGRRKMHLFLHGLRRGVWSPKNVPPFLDTICTICIEGCARKKTFPPFFDTLCISGCSHKNLSTFSTCFPRRVRWQKNLSTFFRHEFCQRVLANKPFHLF